MNTESTFVLYHPERRMFVSPAGREFAYTRSVINARLFFTREEAERERCVESEVVRLVSDFFPHGGNPR